MLLSDTTVFFLVTSAEFIIQRGNIILFRVTDSNGRVAIVHPGYDLKNGHYLLHFYTGSYFSNRGMDTFYPYVEVRISRTLWEV